MTVNNHQTPIKLERQDGRLGYIAAAGNFVPVELPADAPEAEVLDNTPVVYEQPKFPKRAYNIAIFHNGRSHPLKTGQRFSGRSPVDGTNKTYVYIAVMQPFRLSSEPDDSLKQHAFFVSEGMLQPFHMGLGQFIKQFETGRFVLQQGTADLGNQYHGADSTFT